MDLIFIYGAPGVGKYTVAKELEKKLDYRIFHNHLTIDLIRTIHEWGTPEFSKLNRKIRLEYFKSAQKSNIPGLIFTFCYRPGKNDSFIKNIIDIFRKNSGKIYFIYLTCQKNELYKRIESEERKKFKKITTKEGLDNCIHHFGKIEFVENIEIDNTDATPENVAESIIKKIK